MILTPKSRDWKIERTTKQPTDKVLVHPALERWWKEKGRSCASWQH